MKNTKAGIEIYDKAKEIAEKWILNNIVGNFGKTYMRKYFIDVHEVFINNYCKFQKVPKKINSIQIWVWYSDYNNSTNHARIRLFNEEIANFVNELNN